LPGFNAGHIQLPALVALTEWVAGIESQRDDVPGARTDVAAGIGQLGVA
jgi:hypothetical protein